MRRIFTLLLAVFALTGSPFGLAQSDCGIVLMHGKWGSPQFMGPFANRLKSVCSVKVIEMPWSKRRAYDADYLSALNEVAAQVEAMRKQGIKRVFVAGHSLGANAAIAYMASHGDADGIIALAPGHAPERLNLSVTSESVDRAREMVASGRGNERATFQDINMGQRQKFRMRAEVYLSYFDPEGLANMAKSAEGFKHAVPFAWIMGTSDPMYPVGPKYAFEKAPMHSKSAYVSVQADHLSVIDAVGSNAVIAWIRGLSE